MRLWIAAFFLFFFSCQALPVAALGKALAKTQISLTDDDVDDGDDGDSSPSDGAKQKKSTPVLGDFLHCAADLSMMTAEQAAQLLFLHRADHLPVIYAGEVASPPPDLH